MSIHPDGTGKDWTNVETVDVDQPHGKDYLYSRHIAIGVRKRLDQEHSTFADDTAGGIHTPGGCAILGMEISDDGGDITTPVIGDGTYRARGLVWSWDGSQNARLWCATKDAGNSVTGDWTVLMMHPDKQWGGRDVTWVGAHEFDASVDISGNLTIEGDVTIEGHLLIDSSFDCSDVYIAGDVTVLGKLIVDSSADFSTVFIANDFSIDGTTMLSNTVLTGDVTFTFDPIAGETGPTFKIFGDWSSRSNNTTYQARTDGLVTAYSTASPGTILKIITDVNANPTTIRTQTFGAGSNSINTTTCLIKKADYWCVSNAATVYWIPFGDNT